MYKETLTLIYNFDDNHISLTSSNLHFKRQILTQTVVKCTVVKFFPFLAQVACFPTYDSAYMFYYAWLCLHVFPLMTLLTCFPTHDTGYMFCHTWHWLHVLPHMARQLHVSYAWLGFHVFLSLRLVTCFPTHDLTYMFSHASHRHTCFLCLTLVTCILFHCLVLKHVPSISHLSTCYTVCSWSHVLPSLTALTSLFRLSLD